MSKKVLIVHLAHWDQLLGGSEQQLKYITDYLLKSHVKVHFIFPRRNNNKLSESGIINHQLKNFKLNNRFGKVWFRFKGHLKRIISKIKPDLIITRSYSSWSGIIAQYSKNKNIRHIHFIASDSEVKIQKQAIKPYRIFDRIEKRIAKHIFNHHTELIVQNDFQYKYLYDEYNIKTRKMTQLIPIESFQINKSMKRLEIVWIANFKPLKRPEKYIELVKKFQNDPLINFVMIGGYTQRKYKDLITEASVISNFKYLGPMNRTEINDILDKSHVLINTSDYEGFSNTFIEAWMRQNIVISLNSDPDNILNNGEIGYKTNNLDNTFKVLSHLKQDIPKIIKMGINAREYVILNHNIEGKLEFIVKN